MYYVGKDDAQLGPFPLEELVRMYHSGDVHVNDLVWKEGMDDWQPASTIPELTRSEPPRADLFPASPSSRSSRSERERQSQSGYNPQAPSTREHPSARYQPQPEPPSARSSTSHGGYQGGWPQQAEPPSQSWNAPSPSPAPSPSWQQPQQADSGYGGWSQPQAQPQPQQHPHTSQTGGWPQYQPQPWTQPAPVPSGPQIPTHFRFAILATLLLCPPLGVAALIFALRCGRRQKAGDWEGARQASEEARTWCWIALGAGLLLAIIYTAAYGSAAASGLVQRKTWSSYPWR